MNINVSRKFEDFEEKLIKYVNARAMNYKHEKCGTPSAFLQKSARYGKKDWSSQILKDLWVGSVMHLSVTKLKL